MKSKELLKIIVKNLVISIIFISISLVIIIFIKNKIEHITNTIVLNRTLEAELKKRTEFMSAVEHDASIIGSNDVLIENAFPSSNNISNFINKFNDLVSMGNVTQTYHFDSPLPGNMQGPFPISTISYNNTMNTDVLYFSNYLKSFNNLPYFSKIENLQISSQDKTGWLGPSNITFKATLVTKTTQ